MILNKKKNLRAGLASVLIFSHFCGDRYGETT